MCGRSLAGCAWTGRSCFSCKVASGALQYSIQDVPDALADMTVRDAEYAFDRLSHFVVAAWWTTPPLPHPVCCTHIRESKPNAAKQSQTLPLQSSHSRTTLPKSHPSLASLHPPPTPLPSWPPWEYSDCCRTAWSFRISDGIRGGLFLLTLTSEGRGLAQASVSEA